MGILVALNYFEVDYQRMGLSFFYLHRNYGMVVVLLSFLFNYGNLTLKLYQEKRSYPDEGWLVIGRFKVGNVPGMSVALEATKKGIQIHDKRDARPSIKSYDCY